MGLVEFAREFVGRASIYENRPELVSKEIDFNSVRSQVPNAGQFVVASCSEFSRPILRFDLTHEAKSGDVEGTGGGGGHVYPSETNSLVETLGQ